MVELVGEQCVALHTRLADKFIVEDAEATMAAIVDDLDDRYARLIHDEPLDRHGKASIFARSHGANAAYIRCADGWKSIALDTDWIQST